MQHVLSIHTHLLIFILYFLWPIHINTPLQMKLLLISSLNLMLLGPTIDSQWRRQLLVLAVFQYFDKVIAQTFKLQCHTLINILIMLVMGPPWLDCNRAIIILQQGPSTLLLSTIPWQGSTLPLHLLITFKLPNTLILKHIIMCFHTCTIIILCASQLIT